MLGTYSKYTEMEEKNSFSCARTYNSTTISVWLFMVCLEQVIKVHFCIHYFYVIKCFLM